MVRTYYEPYLKFEGRVEDSPRIKCKPETEIEKKEKMLAILRMQGGQHHFSLSNLEL